MANLQLTTTANTPLKTGSGALAASRGPEAVAQANAQVFGDGLGSVDSVRAELADVCADMKAFCSAEPDQVMTAVSAHGARLVEIKILASRLEVQHKQWKVVRQEVEDVLSELRFQFNVASRLISVRQLDQDLLRGGA